MTRGKSFITGEPGHSLARGARHRVFQTLRHDWANAEARRLLWTHGFYHQAECLSVENDGYVIENHLAVPCDVAADLLEENNFTQLAREFRSANFHTLENTDVRTA